MNEFKPVRALRLAAFVVDWHLTVIPAFVFLFASELLPATIQPYAMFVGIFCCFGLYFFRDYLFGGRSPGKRLVGLSVVDRSTGLPATGKQLLIKNLFTWLVSIDGLVLLLSGKSLAERATDTAVVQGEAAAPLVWKRFLKVEAVAAALGLILSGAVSFGLNAAKDNESYAISYAWLTESNTFARQEEDGAEPVLVGFTHSTHGTREIQSYTFETDSHVYTVVCHPDDNGAWAVCGDCTEFE